MSLCFFFCGYCAHRYLHSFPTRRSSDLPGAVAGPKGSAVRRLKWYASWVQNVDNTALPGSNSRSEEHTSELQSQSNLVCRLLLEKKKKTQHTPLIVSIPFTPRHLL